MIVNRMTHVIKIILSNPKVLTYGKDTIFFKILIKIVLTIYFSTNLNTVWLMKTFTFCKKKIIIYTPIPATNNKKAAVTVFQFSLILGCLNQLPRKQCKIISELSLGNYFTIKFSHLIYMMPTKFTS